MIRILIWIVFGFWWTPAKNCLAYCPALRAPCSSGFCLLHCTKHCYCGVGASAREVAESLPETGKS